MLLTEAFTHFDVFAKMLNINTVLRVQLNYMEPTFMSLRGGSPLHSTEMNILQSLLFGMNVEESLDKRYEFS